MLVTPIFLGLLVLMQVPLTIAVGHYRLKSGIHFLDGQNTTMIRRMRAHGNFIETVPIALLAMLLAEFQGAPSLLLWGVGFSLLLGRLIHAFTLLKHGWGNGRAIGMSLTMAAMITSGGYLLVSALTASG